MFAITIKIFRSIIINFFIFRLDCVEAKSSTRSVLKKIENGSYQENLSAYRVMFVKAKKEKRNTQSLSSMPLDKTVDLEALLLKRKLAYQMMERLPGYTIQIYMGNSRVKALQLQEQVSSFIRPHVPILVYREPNYTIHFGFFSDKLEAYFIYLRLKKKIPTAIIRPYSISREAYQVLGTQNLLSA